MEHITDRQIPGRSADSLYQFLCLCQKRAIRQGRGVLGSISLEVSHIDPLGVLQAIDEPDQPSLYMEQPQADFALAGAEPVVVFEAEGTERFKRIKHQAETLFAEALAIGDVDQPLAGPHVLCAFTFEAQKDARSPHVPAYAFVPRWQVGRQGGRYTAVANAWVQPDTDLGPLVKRLLAAHERFSGFAYGSGASARLSHKPVATGARDIGHDYLGAVGRALEQIRAGTYEKIVLSRAVDAQVAEPLDPLKCVEYLSEHYPACWSVALRGKAAAVPFVCATPERLVRVQRGQLLTEAIAATAPRGRSAREDATLASGLMSSDKMVREHRSVVNALLESLKYQGVQATAQQRPRLIKLPNCQHLKTEVTATLDAEAAVHLLDAAQALHPTPAVGGWPREAALPQLATLEGYPRGLYTGLVGWFDAQGDGELLVNLRAAELDGHRVRAYAGAGIVAGSVAGEEFAETEAKLQGGPVQLER
jgi:menaquinone-specific isochorismate synthase